MDISFDTQWRREDLVCSRCEWFDLLKPRGDCRSAAYMLRLLVARENGLLTLKKGTFKEVEVERSYFRCINVRFAYASNNI